MASENATWYNNYGKQLETSSKVKHSLNMQTSNSSPTCMSERSETGSNTDMCMSFHSNIPIIMSKGRKNKLSAS